MALHSETEVRPAATVLVPGYRLGREPALDGLRGLAVVAVLLFHAGVPGFAGGYLGVSVFFVLSGFLISSLLLREFEGAATIGFRSFSARRLRRLLPAQMACWLLVVALSAWMVSFPRIRYPSDVLWAASQMWNWKEIASGTSYAGAFQTFGASSPFTHLWSLAVEEQIYLVMPVVILLLCRRQIVRRAGAAPLLAAVVVIIAVPLVARRFVSPNAVYLATPLRAGEVAAGIVAALVLRRIGLRRWMAPAGLVALVAVAVLVGRTGATEQAWPYQGGLGAFGILTALALGGCLCAGPVRSVLSVGVLRGIGLISFGLYLYHWPIYLAIRDDTVHVRGAALVVLRLAVTLAAAVVSYHLLEQPIRRGAVRLPSLVPLAATAVLALVVVGRLIPTPHAVVTEARSIDPTKASAVAITPAPPSTAAPAAAGSPPAPPAPRDPSVLVVGDSTAASVGAGIVEALASGDARGSASVDASGACGIRRGGNLESDVLDSALQMTCPQLMWQTVPDDVERLRPGVVAVLITLADTWPRTYDGGATWTPVAGGDGLTRLREDYTAWFQLLRGRGATCVVWITGPTANILTAGGRQPEDSYADGSQQAVAGVVADLQRDGLVDADIDLAGWYAANMAGDDTTNRPDGIHLTVDAAEIAAHDWLWQQLAAAQTDCPSPT